MWKNTVVEQGGIYDISERLGLGRNVEILLARLKKSTRDAMPAIYSIKVFFKSSYTRGHSIENAGFLHSFAFGFFATGRDNNCLLYTSDAADE